MYSVSHCFQFRDSGRGLMYAVSIEYMGDALTAAGTLDDRHERAGAWIAGTLNGKDLEAAYGRLTVERLASAIFHSVREFTPWLTAVSVECLGEEYGRMPPRLAPGTPSKTIATYRDGPGITDMLKLRSALASLGVYNPHEQA
jgi:hypothetical protein